MLKEKGIYYADNSFYELIEKLGGNCGQPGHRPIVCLIESIEHSGIYWAIPMGNVKHRSKEAIDRITRFMNYPESDIRSCFYHLGRTTNHSIFFISDVFPITEKYIEEEHLGIDKNHYIIKNHLLTNALERKLFRILFYENANKNYFRQHISDIKKYLITEIEKDTD